MTTLAITSVDADRLFAGLDADSETGWILGVRAAADGALLLGRRLRDVRANAYRERGPRRMTIASQGYVSAFSAVQHDGCLAAFVHTHPGGDPSSSPLDEEVNRQLAEFVASRGGHGYVALIIGGTTASPRFSGLVVDASGSVRPIERLRVVGRRLRVLIADGTPDETPPAIFDRQVRAFGPAGQRLLASLRVGVVGAGGTGSPTVEQLARLGLGEMIVIDDDTVDDTNLTRIHGSTTADVGRYKAELAAALARTYGTGTRVTAVVGSAATRAGIEALLNCDVVFGCTDDHAGRLVLSRLAYRYLIPVIDCGVIVDSDGDEIHGVIGRVTFVAPGEPCLICRGQVNPRAAAEEMMDPDRRLELAGQGYAGRQVGPAPAVVSFTTLTSAYAVSDLLGRLFGYNETTPSQVLLRLHAGTISHAGRAAQPGHYCAVEDEWGAGDSDPPLGMAGLQ